MVRCLTTVEDKVEAVMVTRRSRSEQRLTDINFGVWILTYLVEEMVEVADLTVSTHGSKKNLMRGSDLRDQNYPWFLWMSSQFNESRDRNW